MTDDSKTVGGQRHPSRRRRWLSATKQLLGGLSGRVGRPKVPDSAPVVFVDIHGTAHPMVEADTGQTLLAIAKSAGADISSYCGGQCSCGTCRVQVESGADGLTPRTPNEAMVLGEAQVRAGERLACQARVIGPVRVRLLDRY